MVRSPRVAPRCVSLVLVAVACGACRMGRDPATRAATAVAGPPEASSDATTETIAEPEPIVRATLAWDGSTMRVVDAVRAVGFVPDAEESGELSVTVTDEGGATLYAAPLAPPVFRSEGASGAGAATFTPPTFVLVAPLEDGASALAIADDADATLARIDLASLPPHGEPPLVDALVGTATGASLTLAGGRPFAVVFFRDAAVSPAELLAAMQGYQTAIAATEPFAGRSAGLLFRTLSPAPPVDFECVPSGGDEAAHCNAAKIAQTLAAFTSPMDVAVVVTKALAGEVAYGPAIVAPAADAGANGDLLVHALGHQLGRLLDEDPAAATGALDGQAHGLDGAGSGNCFAGAAPFAGWTDLADAWDYTPGCGGRGDWLAAGPSVMRRAGGLGRYGFNAVAQRELGRKLDAVVGATPLATHPTVTWRAPASGATLKGTATVAVDLFGRTTRMRLYVDGVPRASVYPKAAGQAQATLDVDTTRLADGSHRFFARCYGGDGGFVDTPEAAVTVNNHGTALSVRLTAPAAGQSVQGDVVVAADAAGTGLARVEFADGATALGAVTAPPFRVTWSTGAPGVPSGPHVITARAVAADGASAQDSVSVMVTKDPDATPPTVVVTAPSPQQQVVGRVNVTAFAQDDLAVARVDFFVDGRPLGNSAAAPFGVTWDATAERPGSQHTLTARAFDRGGRAAEASVVVQIQAKPDKKKPTAVLVTPKGNAVLKADPVVVTVRATDDVGVAKVELAVDNKWVATSTAAPFTLAYPLGAFKKGAHTLKARATDFAGKVGVSKPVKVKRK
jgi:hypothetical protein